MFDAKDGAAVTVATKNGFEASRVQLAARATERGGQTYDLKGMTSSP